MGLDKDGKEDPFFRARDKLEVIEEAREAQGSEAAATRDECCEGWISGPWGRPRYGTAVELGFDVKVGICT